MQFIQTWLKTQLKPTHSSSSKSIQQEYTTRIIIITLTIIMIFASLILILGWLLDKYPADMAITSVIAIVIFVISWVMLEKGYWRVSRYSPIVFTYFVTLYTSIVYGNNAINILFYVAIVFFAASVLSIKQIWGVSFLSLTSFLVIEYNLRQHHNLASSIPQLTNFAGFATIIIILFVGLTILISHFTSQYQQSLIKAENYAAELELHKQHLEATVAARTIELQNSLAEKEVLLKEVHHRVKNNLQIVSGLLYLQARQTPSPDVRTPLEESYTRVKSMAMVHEMLYQSPNLGKIDFSNYAQRLINFIAQSYKNPHITLDFNIESIILPIDTAITIGLIFNELVSNVYKHAFPKNDEGTLIINFTQDKANKYHFMIADTGRGFNKTEQEAIKNAGLENFNRQKSLGLQLVTQLTRQLQGEITLSHNGGTTFEIVF